MTVTNVEQDLVRLTLTLTADFDATPEQVWQLWADPRLLERWWGPPDHPATFERHELRPGGEAAYFMRLPDGGTSRGWWRVESVDPPRSLTFTDGWADQDGRPVTEAPSSVVRMELTEHDGGTRMRMESRFASREAMEQVLRMGLVEGLQLSVGQMDALLVR